MRQEAVEEHRLRMAADLNIGEDAEDRAVGELRVAELVIVQPQPGSALALGEGERGARILRRPLELLRIDAGVLQHHGDTGVHAFLIGEMRIGLGERSEEHTSELQSLMRISYAVFCLKKKKQTMITNNYYSYYHTQLNTTILYREEYI